LILKTSFNIICTFLFDSNDYRVINLFKFTTFILETFARKKTVKDEDLMSIVITASLTILKKIMKLNQSIQIIMKFT